MDPVVTPLGRLPWWLILVANAAYWPVWTFGCGYLAHRQPPVRFDADGWLSRLRTFEADGRWYEQHLRIRAWKDVVPEAGALFGGGVSKRRLLGSDDASLAAFVRETRRAELAHWAGASGVVVPFLWNPIWAWPAHVLVASASNLPCIAVQRYTRGRLLRTLRRRPDASPPRP